MLRVFENNTQEYPIVLLPEKIKRAIIEGFDDNMITLKSGVIKPVLKYATEPNFPLKKYHVTETHEKTKYTGGCFPIFITIVICIVALVLQSISYLLWLVLLLPAMSYILDIPLFKEEQENVSVLKEMGDFEFEDLQSRYSEKYTTYQESKVKFEQEYQKSLFEYDQLLKGKRVEVIRNTFLEYIKPERVSQRINNPQKRGTAEIPFLEILLVKFKDIIFMDKAPIGKYGRPIYFPDFTFICPNTNLHIDIEIDEPYNNQDKSPIHYTENNESIDRKRNEYFLDINWCIIKFSEKQIIKHPNQCIETINNVYSSIINMEKYYECPLTIQSAWTYEEALIKSIQNERNNYS